MRHTLILVLLFFGTGLLTAGGDAKTDLKAMAGSWKATIIEIDGKPAEEKEKDAPIKLVIKEDKFTVFVGDKVMMSGTTKLNPAKTPKEIDAEQTEGPYKGKTQKGLYEFKGMEMRVIFAEPGNDRPTSFKTRAGEVLLQYERMKDAKK